MENIKSENYVYAQLLSGYNAVKHISLLLLLLLCCAATLLIALLMDLGHQGANQLPDILNFSINLQCLHATPLVICIICSRQQAKRGRDVGRLCSVETVQLSCAYHSLLLNVHTHTHKYTACLSDPSVSLGHLVLLLAAELISISKYIT